MTNKRRGLYKKTSNNLVNSRPTNFFKEGHEGQGYVVSWADAYDRGNGVISICYKIMGDRKQYRSPRWKTAWFDGKPISDVKLAVKEWKESNNNSIGTGNLIPNFYLSHRREYIKWLSSTAKHITIYQYEQCLKQYVFPFLVGRLNLEKPSKWTQDFIDKWDAALSDFIPKATSRNRKRTAFRRYLKFLKRSGEIKTIPQIFDEATKRDTRETIIPGELPTWDDVLTYLKSLKPGRYRFLRAISIGFGLRLSEAFAIEEEDFFGAESQDEIESRNDFISRLVEKELGILFLYVNKADKKLVPRDFIKILGDQDNEPKSGPYTACCTNAEIAAFIVEMLENGEHRESLNKNELYRTIYELPIDKSEFKFHEYRPHDDRRLNITLQCLDLSMDVNDVVEICTLLHGQSSREVFNRYFQWGLTQRRRQKSKSGVKLTIFKAK